jgi:[DsrC]-trisulfide reductase subunit J
MYDAKKIVPGLLIFLGLVTFPFWFSGGKAAPPPGLKLDTPAIQQLKEKKCIEPTAYMRANHMELLDYWRNSVVRQGDRIYKASDGKEYPLSLSGTCLECHSNKEQFCDRCHTYEAVKPTCWSCHVIPQEKS